MTFTYKITLYSLPPLRPPKALQEELVAHSWISPSFFVSFLTLDLYQFCFPILYLHTCLSQLKSFKAVTRISSLCIFFTTYSYVICWKKLKWTTIFSEIFEPFYHTSNLMIWSHKVNTFLLIQYVSKHSKTIQFIHYFYQEKLFYKNAIK